MAREFDAFIAALAETCGDQLYLAQGKAQARDLAGQPLFEAGAEVARRQRRHVAGAGGGLPRHQLSTGRST